jgi:hypothetical protein
MLAVVGQEMDLEMGVLVEAAVEDSGIMLEPPELLILVVVEAVAITQQRHLAAKEL